MVWDAYPTIYSLYLSLTDWNLLGPKRYVGLANYQAMLTDPILHGSALTTVLWVLLTVPTVVLVGLGLAALIHSTTRMKEFFRVTYFLPVVTPTAAVALVWSFLYQPNTGLFSYLAESVGIHGVQWLASPATALVSLALLTIWKNAGYYMIIYLAALQTVPKSLYEAASLDGATRWQIFRHVELPRLRSIHAFVILTAVLGSFNTFTEVFMMTRGGPSRATTLLAYYQYEMAFQRFRMGYASAIGVTASILLMAATIFLFISFRRSLVDPESA
jgi:multiple sugar transport system permease protein